MKAIFETGGKQYYVSEGDVLYVEKLDAEAGKELELLEMLLLNKKQIIKKETLVSKIWGYESEAEYNNVEVYVSFLRRKLKLLQSKVKIKAVRGIGYKLEEENDG